MKKKVFACIIVAIMIISLFSSVTVTAENNTGYYGEVIVDYEPTYPELDNYPISSISRFDPRTKSGTTPVKAQVAKTCSFFATNAVMEMASYLNTGVKYSYSEESVSWIMSTKLSEINGLLRGDSGYYNRTIDDGSNFYYTSAIVTNMNNPIIPNNNIS